MRESLFTDDQTHVHFRFRERGGNNQCAFTAVWLDWQFMASVSGAILK